MEINVVTLHKVVKTMAQQMLSVIKAKGGPTKYYSVRLWTGGVSSNHSAVIKEAHHFIMRKTGNNI